METIDVGPGAINRGNSFGSNYTLIDKANPANLDGTIDHIDIWLATYIGGKVDFASFDEVDTNNFTTRGTASGLTPSSGDNDFDAPGDFTAFTIKSGDYIGCTETAAEDDWSIERDISGGSGIWYYDGKKIPCTETTFSLLINQDISIYATGVESAGYPPQAWMF